MGVEGLSEREVMFGRLAVESGQIDESVLERSLAIRRDRMARGEHPTKLPTILKEEGHFSDEQFDTLRRRVLETYPKERKRHRLGSYEIEKRIGKGGMGIVYRARHVETGEIAAIKVLGSAFKEDRKLRERFEREHEAIRKVRHDHLVPGYQAGTQDGVYYFVMEYIAGDNVRDRIRRQNRFEVEEAVRIGIQISRALQAIHEAGYVHRDVKSSNILLDESGRVAKLSDLGLAMDLESDAGLTRFGTGLGSAEYASPEQLQNAAEIDRRTDIYGLGVTLFEMLAGRVPYYGMTPSAVIRRKIKDPVPDLHRFRPDAPGRLRDLVRSMMSKDPKDRPQSPRAVISVLESIEDDRGSDPKGGGARRTTRRHAISGAVRTQDPPPPIPWFWFCVGFVLMILIGLVLLL